MTNAKALKSRFNITRAIVLFENLGPEGRIEGPNALSLKDFAPTWEGIITLASVSLDVSRVDLSSMPFNNTADYLLVVAKSVIFPTGRARGGIAYSDDACVTQWAYLDEEWRTLVYKNMVGCITKRSPMGLERVLHRHFPLVRFCERNR